jgi:heavy metal sensor kinase
MTGSADGRRVRIVTVPFAGTGVLEVGMPVDEFVEVIDQFETTALIAVPLLVLFAMAAGYWMSARALAPVQRVTLASRAISTRHLDERLPLRGADDEIDRLSQTLNDMFLRLHQGFQRITRFTADASHELRTPVAIIRTTAEICRQQPRATHDYEAALDRIIAESARAGRLIDDLLTLARADGGAQMERVPIDLVEVVQDAVDDGAILCETAGVQLEAPLTGRLPIAGDPDALRRLFLALLENAAKYTKPGGRVRVTTRYDGGAAVVEVADTGVGIPPADLSHVFDRFYRASPDRSRATGGTGLGLSIAQWIATAHNGTIGIESTLGAGTRVTVSVPSLQSPS